MNGYPHHNVMGVIIFSKWLPASHCDEGVTIFWKWLSTSHCDEGIYSISYQRSYTVL